jgi:two-component system response regulator DesR
MSVRPVRVGPPSGGRRVRVLVVDDHDVVHWGFRLLLEKQSWVESCAAATGGASARREAAKLRPHVALVDLFLAGESGAEVAEELKRAQPEMKVLLISGAGRISPAVARAAGASGFVSKDWGAADVVRAVRMVALGQEVFAPAPEGGDPSLSPREREVVAHISRGSTNAEIARALFLSPHTVKEHTSAIYRKLGVRNRAEAVKAAQRHGLIT